MAVHIDRAGEPLMPMNVRTKVWFTTGNRHAFGDGLARLLENVDRYGTLRRSATETGMSYRHAWNLIKNAETHLRKRLVVKYPGGVGGGRSELSRDGRRLLKAFHHLTRDVARYANSRFSELLGKETDRE
jgi:molybdate transport repressor ModE-like protein